MSVEFAAKAGRPTWIEVDLAALANNVRHLRQRIGPNCLLMAVVKANAYGHGAVATAATCLAAGADWLAVATLEEAVELRTAGLDCPLLVLGFTPATLASRAIHFAVTLTVYDVETLRALNEQSATTTGPVSVHVKVNTGMNRLGVPATEVEEFLRVAASFRQVNIEGLFTHFATADTDRDYANVQLARFCHVLGKVERSGMRPPLVHAANSAATLTMPEAHLDMVRCGIALYGLHPDAAECRLPLAFRPALCWKAIVVHTADLAAGEAVSYGREFVADRPMRIAVIPVGYADGFPRRPRHWGHVLIHGMPAPILGRVCMDQTVVDITSIEEVSGRVVVGDEVVLIGKQGDTCLSADDVAQRIGTINYDVVSRILARVPRVMIDMQPSSEKE